MKCSAPPCFSPLETNRTIPVKMQVQSCEVCIRFSTVKRKKVCENIIFSTETQSRFFRFFALFYGHFSKMPPLFSFEKIHCLFKKYNIFHKTTPFLCVKIIIKFTNRTKWSMINSRFDLTREILKGRLYKWAF